MINGELVTELNEHSTYATLIFKINGEEVRLDNMETKTLNKLCAALECKLEEIAEYVED